MDYVFQGLPLHVLLVHAMVIAVPLVAVLLVVLAAWPGARRVLWIPTLIAAALLVPLGLVTIEAGKWLRDRVPDAPLIQAHTSLGESIVPWLYAVLGIAVLVAAWQVVTVVARRRGADSEHAVGARRTTAVVVGIVLTLAAAAVAAGAIWTVVQIGESGSRAVWQGSFSDTPLER
ncbi:hypothetical protein SAMN05428970_2046 [Agromyces sp. CF514]|uniref:hypothetical protein n=1 Tax=Agromyces sp. CF514 TaxID=1881031 RepID=UPI0008EA6878|nr:hypothetical protein [Agromyces sp. CF514]SFR76304.1 hypothetical protein SAMN05428970_2046 [Agromyces sp. CF514]